MVSPRKRKTTTKATHDSVPSACTTNWATKNNLPFGSFWQSNPVAQLIGCSTWSLGSAMCSDDKFAYFCASIHSGEKEPLGHIRVRVSCTCQQTWTETQLKYFSWQFLHSSTVKTCKIKTVVATSSADKAERNAEKNKCQIEIETNNDNNWENMVQAAPSTNMLLFYAPLQSCTYTILCDSICEWGYCWHAEGWQNPVTNRSLLPNKTKPKANYKTAQMHKTAPAHPKTYTHSTSQYLIMPNHASSIDHLDLNLALCCWSGRHARIC